MKSLENTIATDTKRAINKYKQIDRLVGFSNTKWGTQEQRYSDKQYIEDKKMLRQYYASQGDMKTSLEVLNWPRTKIEDKAFEIKDK